MSPVALTFLFFPDDHRRVASPVRHRIGSSLGPRRFGSGSGDLVDRTAEKGYRKSTPFLFLHPGREAIRSRQKDEAVFWFYAGQLRYRVYLLANKDKLKPSGDPALFASLSEEIGRPLNEYAFGDIPQLAKTIDAVPGVPLHSTPGCHAGAPSALKSKCLSQK
jgi:hypothetical protein